MTNLTIYKRAHQLSFAQFCRWMKKRKTRDSNNASSEPSSVVECSSVGSSQTVIRKLTGGALPIYEDNN
jgi:hypothetical protein